MPFKISRVPRGLVDLLSAFGGVTPPELEDRIRAVVELVQFYGMQHLTVQSANNAAAAKGVGVVITPSTTNWAVLFMATTSIVKTATVTALSGQVFIRRSSGLFNMCVAERALGPFGAAETGVAAVPFIPPYPMLLPPGSTITGVANILGTDATANVIVGAEFGLLG